MPRLKYYNNKINKWEYADTSSGEGSTNFVTKEYVDNLKVDIDATLSIEGAAADAKAVGDLIHNLPSDDTVIRIKNAIEESSTGKTRYGVTIEGPTIFDENGDTGINYATVWDGTDGEDGKSAYAYAQEAGYTGTEEEFAEMLANAGNGSGGNADFRTDETLTLKDGVLFVNTTNNMEQDNTLPITSAGVFATVGNIEALLKTI